MNRIKAIRKHMGLNGRELAERLGVSAQRVSDWEGGRTGVGHKWLAPIAAALGVTPSWLDGHEAHLPIAGPDGQIIAAGIVAETIIPGRGIAYTLETAPGAWVNVLAAAGKLYRTDGPGRLMQAADAAAARWIDSEGRVAVFADALI